jgi:hypothetical protein
MILGAEEEYEHRAKVIKAAQEIEDAEFERIRSE